jgi:parallel beta-helix repeat protein
LELVPEVEDPADEQALIVSQQGDGQFQTITEALAQAAPGGRVRVRPGVYAEELVLTKPVELIGSGPVDQVVVEGREDPCLTMDTDSALVRGLTFRGRAGAAGGEAFAVDIPRSRLILENCAVTSDSLACVAVHGEGAEPILRRCKIHGGNQTGVLVCDGAAGTLESCDIFGHSSDGVTIKTSGNPTLRGCRVHDNKEAGVWFHEQGLGTLEDCELFGNGVPNVHVKNGANPTVRGCRIHGGKIHGVAVEEQGRGTFEACDIFQNANAGFEVRRRHRPRPARRRGQRHGVTARRILPILVKRMGRSFVLIRGESCLSRRPFHPLKPEVRT